MEGSSGGPSAEESAANHRRHNLGAIRRMLAVGAAPADDAWGDDVLKRHTSNPDATVAFGAPAAA